MMWKTVLALCAVHLALVAGQMVGQGPCPAVKTNPVDMNKFRGLWYSVEDIPNALDPATCVTYDFTPGHNETLTMINKQYVHEEFLTTPGDGYRPDPTNQPGWIRGKFGEVPGFYFNYYIVKTDYHNSALFTGCVAVLDRFHIQWAFIMSRTRRLPQATIDSYRPDLKAQGINPAVMQKDDQTAAVCKA